MSIPPLLVAGFILAFSHFILLAGVPRRAGAALSLASVRQGHPWLLIACVLTLALVAITAVEGAYWYATSGMLWLYFYASIAAVRYERHVG
jgi:hypothetical protein